MKFVRKCLVSFFIIIGICIVIACFFIKGNIITLEKISEQQENRILNEFDVTFDEKDSIEQFQFMTFGGDSFFVLKVKVNNFNTFKSNNQNLSQYIYEYKTRSILFSNKNLLPKNSGLTIYYTKEHIYISAAGPTNQKISNLFFELYNN